jgi:hypothetical protein
LRWSTLESKYTIWLPLALQFRSNADFLRLVSINLLLEIRNLHCSRVPF